MCLQYTDFSRTAIGSFVPVLSDGCLKREVSFSLPDIYSVVLLSSPLCSARPTEWRTADGQMGCTGRWRPDKARVSCWPLSDTQAGEKQSALQPLLNFIFACTGTLSQQILCATDVEISKELRTWGEITKNIQPGSNQILPTLNALDE